MQCPNCQFENMPGMTACVRCNAPLNSAPTRGDPVAYMPPRAGRGKRWRVLLRPLRRLGDAVPSDLGVRALRLFLPESDAGIPLDSGAMWASIVPGGGHLLRQRRKPAAVFCALWLAFMVIWSVFIPVTLGGIAFGLAVGLHVAAMADAGGLRRSYLAFRLRLRTLANLLAVVGVSYALLNVSVSRRLLFARARFPVPFLDVAAGDIIRFNRDPPDERPWRPAELCLVEMLDGQQFRWRRGYYGVPVGEFLGFRLAGEGQTVEVGPEGIRVNGTAVLSRDDMEMGNLVIRLTSKVLHITVPEHVVMVVFPLNLARAPAGTELDGLLNDVYSRLYLVHRDQIIGRGIGVYLPLGRHHRFGGGEPTVSEESED